MMLGQLLNRESLRNLIVAMEIENRPIYGVTITKDTGNPDENTNKTYKDEHVPASDCYGRDPEK